jgi:hypothetical protein
VERNLIQVCLMGEHHRWELEELLNVLASFGAGSPAAPPDWPKRTEIEPTLSPARYTS